jgi:hypothetical protein
VIPENHILKINQAHFVHGFYTGASAIKKTLAAIGGNVYMGHLHSVEGTTIVSAQGLMECMSIGCLRQLQAPFMRGKPHSWANSFLIMEMYKGGYTRYNPIMIDGKFSYNGKLFQ